VVFAFATLPARIRQKSIGAVVTATAHPAAFAMLSAGSGASRTGLPADHADHTDAQFKEEIPPCSAICGQYMSLIADVSPH